MSRLPYAIVFLSLPIMLGAGDVSLVPAFGNTIVATYPDGRTVELWLRPGGSYAAEGRWGARSGGRWIVRNDKLCLKQSTPIPAPFSFCTQIPSARFSSGWTAKAVTGETVRVSLVKGVQEGHPSSAARNERSRTRP